MSEKRSLQEVLNEARAEIKQWPKAMQQLNQFRRDEMRKLDEALLVDGRSSSKK